MLVLDFTKLYHLVGCYHHNGKYSNTMPNSPCLMVQISFVCWDKWRTTQRNSQRMMYSTICSYAFRKEFAFTITKNTSCASKMHYKDFAMWLYSVGLPQSSCACCITWDYALSHSSPCWQARPSYRATISLTTFQPSSQIILFKTGNHLYQLAAEWAEGKFYNEKDPCKSLVYLSSFIISYHFDLEILMIP